MSLATSRPRLSEGRVLRDDNGCRVMDTEWHGITCWGGLGQTGAEHCEKGMKVLVHGRIHYTKWTDSRGNDREIIAFLNRPKSAENENPPGSLRRRKAAWIPDCRILRSARMKVCSFNCHCHIDMYDVNMKANHLHRLVWMSRPLMQAAEECVEAGLDGTELTVRMRAVLEILLRHGSQTVPNIAVRLEIKRQYVQLMVNETLDAGFVEQRENPRHKRSPLLALTEQGRDLIDGIISRELALMQMIGVNFTDEDVAIALDVVLAVTEKLKKLSGERE